MCETEMNDVDRIVECIKKTALAVYEVDVDLQNQTVTVKKKGGIKQK